MDGGAARTPAATASTRRVSAASAGNYRSPASATATATTAATSAWCANASRGASLADACSMPPPLRGRGAPRRRRGHRVGEPATRLLLRTRQRPLSPSPRQSDNGPSMSVSRDGAATTAPGAGAARWAASPPRGAAAAAAWSPTPVPGSPSVSRAQETTGGATRATRVVPLRGHPGGQQKRGVDPAGEGLRDAKSGVWYPRAAPPVSSRPATRGAVTTPLAAPSAADSAGRSAATSSLTESASGWIPSVSSASAAASSERLTSWPRRAAAPQSAQPASSPTAATWTAGVSYQPSAVLTTSFPHRTLFQEPVGFCQEWHRDNERRQRRLRLCRRGGPRRRWGGAR
jgi:hypothetical protein